VLLPFSVNKDLYRVIALVAEGAKVAEERRKTAVDKLLQPPRHESSAVAM